MDELQKGQVYIPQLVEKYFLKYISKNVAEQSYYSCYLILGNNNFTIKEAKTANDSNDDQKTPRFKVDQVEFISLSEFDTVPKYMKVIIYFSIMMYKNLVSNKKQGWADTRQCNLLYWTTKIHFNKQKIALFYLPKKVQASQMVVLVDQFNSQVLYF